MLHMRSIHYTNNHSKMHPMNLESTAIGLASTVSLEAA